MADAKGHGGGGHGMRSGGGHHRMSMHRGGGRHVRRHFGHNKHGFKKFGFKKWHHHGRRFWHGRWYAYGVGSCWKWSYRLDGYVWVCGYDS